MSLGRLVKVCILAYEDKRKEKADAANKLFVLPINPENYSLNLKIEYEKKKGQGNQGTAPKYTGTKPKQLKLDFVLDGTGTVEGYHKSHVGKTVPDQIRHLLAVVYDMNAKTHVPNRLKVNWGEELVFDCVLENLDVNYTLFDRDGTPLRAKLSATFLGHKEEQKRVREENKNSPDLTHVFLLGAGEKLVTRAGEIYGGDEYYRQVALANDLTSFRNVPDGTALTYPPIKKSTARE
ncbi:MAG: hypothetical protein AAFN92_02240 [Bacteroidota bacterium]